MALRGRGVAALSLGGSLIERFPGPVSALVLCGIVAACLWPFRAPANRVAWLAGENGLQFDYPGTIVSKGEFQPVGSAPSCSIELWVQPALREAWGTLLAFDAHRGGVPFALEQSESDLRVRSDVDLGRGRTRNRSLYLQNVFRSLRPLFITFSSGPQGSAIYVDGVLANASRGYRPAAADCAGLLVAGTSPTENEAWAGRLRGLAIYHDELAAAQVRRHYESWTARGRPDLAKQERCAAVYLFDEHGGALVHNRTGPGPDLLIPPKYRIEYQAFVMPFWKEFVLPDILRNIAGFIPFGFFFYAYLSSKPSAGRTMLKVVVVGALVSFIMEILQAYLPTRQSDTMDIITNTFGSWLGSMLYCLLAARGLFRGDPYRPAAHRDP
ncbi:MAG: VanZ family protein [Acidobacteriia bacterium]|nr:VanZ family protein [Terriglobia bacterium]